MPTCHSKVRQALRAQQLRQHDLASNSLNASAVDPGLAAALGTRYASPSTTTVLAIAVASAVPVLFAVAVAAVRLALQ